MACFTGSVDNETKRLRVLLGPLNSISSTDMKIYEQAILFQPVVSRNQNNREVSIENRSPERNACVGQHSEDSSQVLQTLSIGNADSASLFSPLQCNEKTLRVQQTFNMWKAPLDIGWKLKKMKRRKRISLQPLDTFPEFIHNFRYKGKNISFFTFLQEFTKIYFLGFDVDLHKTVDMEKANWNIQSRIHPKTNEKQYLVKDIQRKLQKNIPENTYCAVGISWTDLYPSDDLNFVLGEAQSALNAGVISFGRFEPKAYKDGYVPPPIDHFDGNLIWRILKVLSHETCHIFGLAHCVYFYCNMNESTSLSEAMAQPLYLCPVCLKKLQKVCKFNITERYSLLLQFVQDLYIDYEDCDNFKRTVDWLTKCLNLLTETDNQPM